VLSLLLAQRRSYAEIAALLGIEERAVHDRAHAALALLAPRQARALSAAERELLGEYLLGQADPAQRSAAHAHLEGSAAAAAWARALATELAPLAREPLPAIPAGAAPADASTAPAIPTATPSAPASPAAPAAHHEPARAAHHEPAAVARAPISRRGGAIVLGALAAIAIAVVLIVTLSGGSSGTANPSASSGTGSGTSSTTTPSAPVSTTGSTTSTTGSTTGTTGSATSTTSGPQPKYGKPMVLSPTASAPSAAKGVAFVITLSGKHAFYTFIKGLPPAGSGALYAVWLEGSASEAIPLGSLAAPNSNGLVEGGGSLPANAGSFNRISITRETSSHPTHPGPAVMSGTFTLG